MKKILTYISVLLAVCSCSWFDDSKIWEELREHEERIEKLEALCGRLNSNVEALQGIMEALEANDYVTDITRIMEDGVEVGYSITFAKGGTITVYHGADGADASAPKIGIRKASDGEYYWTADDEWLTDEDGEMIPASVAEDPNGKYIAPLFRVAEGVWYISYDGGDTWKVVPTGGSEGIFKDVTYDNDYLYMTLEDGTIITLPRQKESSEPTTEEKLSFLNFIQSCEIADKMVHFSCDDTYACLYDLILNDTIRGPKPGLLLYIY